MPGWPWWRRKAPHSGDHGEHRFFCRRDPTDDLQVELIEAVWSTMSPAARNNPSSTSNARLIHDLSELLRSATGDNEEPHHARFSKNLQAHVEDDSSGRSDDVTTDNAESPGGDQNGAFSQGQGVLEPGSMDFDLSEAQIREAINELVAGDLSELNDPWEMFNVPEDPPLADPFGEGGEVGIPSSLPDLDLATDPLFVPQSAEGDGIASRYPSLPSVGSDGDWFIPPAMPFDGTSPAAGGSLASESGADQPRWAVPSPAPETVSSTDGTAIEALELVSAALERGELSDVPLHRIASGWTLRCGWGHFDGAAVRTLLGDLIRQDHPGQPEVIDYFARKMAWRSRSLDVWIGRLPYFLHSFQMRQRFLILVEEPESWSVIEVQSQAGKTIHYRCEEPSALNDHDGCRFCTEATAHLDGLARQGNAVGRGWNCQVQGLPTWDRGDGVWAIWVTRLCSEQGDPSEQVPTNYQQTLAREITWDFSAIYNASVIRSPGLPTPLEDSPPLEQYWMEFGQRHGFGGRLWEKVQQIASRPNTRAYDVVVGVERASELLQLALNIASPEVLLAVKGCLAQLRSQRASGPHAYPDSPWGAFDALRSHLRTENLSTIGARLGVWKLHMLKQEYADRIVDVILSEKPPSATVQPGGVQDLLKKDHKGVYWSNLVEHVGNNDLSVLCLIPRTVTIGPSHWARKFMSTSYRDMPIWEKKLVGEICAALRPNVLSSIEPNLSKALLYLQDPGDRYPLETLEDDYIRNLPLSSDAFVGIMRRP